MEYTKEILIEKGWKPIVYDGGHTEYECPWQKGKYNVYTLSSAIKLQKQKDYLDAYGLYARVVQRDPFGYGIYLVPNSGSIRLYCICDTDNTATDTLSEVLASIRDGVVNASNYHTILKGNYGEVNDTPYVFKYGSKYSDNYYIRNYSSFIRTIATIAKDDFSDLPTFEQWYGEIPKISFDNLECVPAEFKESAKEMLARYKQYEQSKLEYEKRQETVKTIVDALDKGEYMHIDAIIWSFYRNHLQEMDGVSLNELIVV